MSPDSAGFDGIDPELRERIARYLSASSGEPREAQQLLVRAYYHGLADGVLRERRGLLAFVEGLVRDRVDAYAALEPTARAVAQHEGAAEVLFTMLEGLMARSGGAGLSPKGRRDA